MLDQQPADSARTSPPGRHSILVVDDDQAVLSLLRRALVVGGYDVLVAEDGEQALALAGCSEPALIVLDVMLPGIDGFTVARRLRAAGPTPILMLTARDTVPDRVTGLDSGADDYLVKPFSMEEFLARVRAQLRRTQAPNDHRREYQDLMVDMGARQAFRGGRLLPLTAREFNLLASLASHPRQALSREQLIQLAWGYTFVGGSNFVDATVKDLRRKMEEQGEIRLIQTVRGYGYALREE